jgi:cytochrome c biogenesis protein CcmG, thiol:disulfide interchange protein DsbE
MLARSMIWLVPKMVAAMRKTGRSKVQGQNGQRQLLRKVPMRRPLPLHLVVIAALVVASAPGAQGNSDLGRPAPALVIEELNGNTFDLAAQRGKVTTVNFWATWCPPCRKEMPALDAFYRRYHNQGVEMLGISADGKHSHSDVTKVMQSLSYPVAMLNDAEANGFGAPDELPESWVVDQDGIVRAKLTADEAPLTEQSLENVVLPLLRKNPGRTPRPAACRARS